MYTRSRYEGRDEPYRIPENYRGNAFRQENDSSVSEPNMTPPPPAEPLPIPEKPVEETGEKQGSPLLSLLPPKPQGLRRGLLSDLGSEELLLLGVFLLLSQNQADDDILLLLLLLLFYK